MFINNLKNNIISRKLKQCWSTILPKLLKRTTSGHLKFNTTVPWR